MLDKIVSTHSRPKAAGPLHWLELRGFTSFNTQPPEGGWALPFDGMGLATSFNTQPPEGGWQSMIQPISFRGCGFNTQPPEGGWTFRSANGQGYAGFNTQPPEGGW